MAQNVLSTDGIAVTADTDMNGIVIEQTPVDWLNAEKVDWLIGALNTQKAWLLENGRAQP